MSVYGENTIRETADQLSLPAHGTTKAYLLRRNDSPLLPILRNVKHNYPRTRLPRTLQMPRQDPMHQKVRRRRKLVRQKHEVARVWDAWWRELCAHGHCLEACVRVCVHLDG